MKRILGVDSLRYVFAVWVFFTHGGAPPLFAGHSSNEAFDMLDKMYGWVINGQAAVIGFFIISGLCIHYPNISRTSINLPSFYTSRLLRLALPLLCCLLLGKILNYQHNDGFLHIVPIWTLYCEAIYYIIYPLVLWMCRKGLLVNLIIGTCILSLALIIFWGSDRHMYLQDIGGGGFLSWKAALVAFPCWLFGVLIAQRVADPNIKTKINYTKWSIVKWRIGALVLSMLTFPLYRLGLYLNLSNHPFGGFLFSSQFTLLVFGLFAFFWIEREVVYTNFYEMKPSALLEKLGVASYSLYLVHTLSIWFFEKIPAQYFPGYLITWIITFVFLHIFMWLFHLVIERPSHKAAKYAGSLFVPKIVKNA